MAFARIWDKNVGYVEVDGILRPWKPTVGLFSHKRRWWLQYQRDRNTGPFPSKKRAIEFYEKGGR